MKRSVSIQTIVDALNCRVLHLGEKKTVSWVVASGLMSDVLTTEKEEILLVSNLTTAQVVRTADMVEANAILITSDKPITQDTLQLAVELNITLLETNYELFEACYRLGKLFDGNDL